MENAKKIIEHAKQILVECENKGYTSGEVSLLILRLEQLKKEADCNSKFYTNSFNKSYYSDSNSSHK